MDSNGNLDRFYAGTSGLMLPVPNKAFYPEAYRDKSRLNYYASMLNSIEINSSFYKIPQPSTVSRWQEDVPENFRFTFKLFREITHAKQLIFDEDLISRFFSVIASASNKAGAILVQFPPSIRVTDLKRLNHLLELLRHADPNQVWDIAVEFRHPSLYNDEIYRLVGNLRMSIVLHDKGNAASPFTETDDPFVYLRFHGPNGDYRGSYDEHLLNEYAYYIKDWLVSGKKVYTYFNNTVGGAFNDLTTLHGILKDLM